MFLLALSFICMALASEGLPVEEPAEQIEMEDVPISAVVNSTDANGHVNYDQRQFGKYNIHLSIKDVNIIEMEPSNPEQDYYGDNEYYYDEPQYTIQALNLSSSTTPTQTNLTPTTEKPLRMEKATESQFSTSIKPTTEGNTQSRPQTTESTTFRLKLQQQQDNLKHMQNMKADFVQELHESSKPQPQVHSKQLIFPLRKSQQKLQTNLVNYPNPIIHQFQPYRCRINQYRDLNGNCHARRVGSSSTNSATAILRKFFNMLVGLPLSNVRDSDSH